MKRSDVLRLVDEMHRDKNIDRSVIFDGIEAALELAAQKYFGEEEEIAVNIDRDTGEIFVFKGEEEIDPTLLGRIPAQNAKNVMIQKIREAESNAVFDEFSAMKGDLVHGAVHRNEPNATIVTIGKTETILPRSEQIPGESHHVNDRIKATIFEVKRSGQRVKIILSRNHPDFVRRLFEAEIPEIQDHIIEIRGVAREAGYRTKIAVSSIDLKVDCVGACVGVRGSRIKNIVDELGGERIDIVRWNDSLQVMIPNALQPAEIKEVFIYQRPGRVIVLVQDDQLSLAIGRRGQNVRLASKLVGWDIEIMTHEELADSIDKALEMFVSIPGVTDEMAEVFIVEGFMSFDDLSFCDPAELIELTGIEQDEAERIIDFAEEQAEMDEHADGGRSSRAPHVVTASASVADTPAIVATEVAADQIVADTAEAETTAVVEDEDGEVEVDLTSTADEEEQDAEEEVRDEEEPNVEEEAEAAVDEVADSDEEDQDQEDIDTPMEPPAVDASELHETEDTTETTPPAEKLVESDETDPVTEEQPSL